MKIHLVSKAQMPVIFYFACSLTQLLLSVTYEIDVFPEKLHLIKTIWNFLMKLILNKIVTLS